MVLTLRELQGLPYASIARVMGITDAAVETSSTAPASVSRLSTCASRARLRSAPTAPSSPS
jgi:Sigma-70, region 4